MQHLRLLPGPWRRIWEHLSGGQALPGSPAPRHPLLGQPWVALKMWLCLGQGDIGGLGKGGTQGVNGCGVKQMFRMDTRPEVVVQVLLLLLRDGCCGWPIRNGI